jgi:hypothetical protein
VGAADTRDVRALTGMLIRRLGVTGMALLLAACTATEPRTGTPTAPPIENISRSDSSQQVGGGGGM